MAKEKLIPTAEVCRIVGYSAVYVYALMAQHLFPLPLVYGAGRKPSLWRESDVRAAAAKLKKMKWGDKSPRKRALEAKALAQGGAP